MFSFRNLKTFSKLATPMLLKNTSKVFTPNVLAAQRALTQTYKVSFLIL